MPPTRPITGTLRGAFFTRKAGESGGERPWTAWAFGNGTNRARLRLSPYMMQTRFWFRKGKTENPFWRDSGRLEDLQRRRSDQVLDSRPILLHVGSNEMGLQERQIDPFLDDCDDVRPRRRLGGNTADNVHSRAVFETSRFGPHFRDHCPKLLQKGFALSVNDLDRRDHVNHSR